MASLAPGIITDRLVAGVVVGEDIDFEVPAYSKDPRASRDLIQFLIRTEGLISLFYRPGNVLARIAKPGNQQLEARAPTAEMAVCLVALKTKGIGLNSRPVLQMSFDTAPLNKK